MKLSTLLALGLAGLILWNVVRLRAVGNLIFFPGSVDSMSLADGNPTMNFNLTVQNTSSVPVEVDSVAGNLFSNNTLVGNISSFVPAVVPANGQVSIPVQARMLLVGIVSDLIQAFTNKNITQNVQVQGFANVQGAQVPINLSISVGA